MKTLQECVENAKCRKGQAAGTTKRGAYWLACGPVMIRSFGGSGIGNSGADCRHYLELRHYRTGEVRALIHGRYWHQDGAKPDRYQPVEILECTTVEQVIVHLKGERIGDEDWKDSVYSDYFEDSLTEALVGLGLAQSEPAPDET